jgi:hypothetical protein
MRCTQPQGLPIEAKAFLSDNAERLNLCIHCGRDSGFVSREIGKTGMYEDLPLFEYTLKNGKTAKEEVQSEIWSSGPMIWLKLIVSDGQVFEWNKEDIRE